MYVLKIIQIIDLYQAVVQAVYKAAEASFPKLSVWIRIRIRNIWLELKAIPYLLEMLLFPPS